MVRGDAAGLEEAAVHVVDAARTGALVQVVDVLGAEVEAVAELLLDVCQGFVGGVGLRGESIAATHGVEAPDERGVSFPGFGRGDLFDTMAVPEASGATEGGESAFGGDARAGEDEEARS